MNLETAQYIKQIVVDASNIAVKATLKAAKETLIRAKTYQVCTRDNVDLDVVSECVQDLLECRAKSVFARCVNNIVWSMDRIIEEQVLARHVAHTVRKFKDETGIEVDAETVERVLKRVNKAGEGFSYNRAKTELLAMDAERTAEALRADGLEETAAQFERVATKQRAPKPAPAPKAKRAGRPVKLLQATFIKEDPAVVAGGRRLRVFIVHLSNGKHYRFVEAYNYVQLMAYGPRRTFYRSVRNDRIMTAIKAGVEQYNAIHADKSA